MVQDGTEVDAAGRAAPCQLQLVRWPGLHHAAGAVLLCWCSYAGAACIWDIMWHTTCFILVDRAYLRWHRWRQSVAPPVLAVGCMGS